MSLIGTCFGSSRPFSFVYAVHLRYSTDRGVTSMAPTRIGRPRVVTSLSGSGWSAGGSLIARTTGLPSFLMSRWYSPIRSGIISSGCSCAARE